MKATFNETLGTPYGAGNTPWTLANIPSGGTTATSPISCGGGSSSGGVCVLGAAATVRIVEGGGEADTAVGGFTVALATGATGVRDAAGNQASFLTQAPADEAAPVLVSATSGGGTAGLMQAGDT